MVRYFWVAAIAAKALINIFRLKNIAVACQKLANAKCFTLNCRGNLLQSKCQEVFKT